MNKPILYIRIDESIIPPHIANICDEVDCRFNNLFYSFFGDALVGDLKNETGTPLYKLLSPVGQLLCDFENANKEAYKFLIKQWYEILALCADDNPSEKPYLGIRIPQDYIDWLQNHVDFIYDLIADYISMSGNAIQLNRQDIIEEVIQESILKKITDAANSSDYKFLSFSNPAICDESYIVKEYSKIPKSLTLLNSDHIIELNQRTDDLFIDLKEYLNGKSFIKHNHDSLETIIEDCVNIICDGYDQLSLLGEPSIRYYYRVAASIGGYFGLSAIMGPYYDIRWLIGPAFQKIDSLIENYRQEHEKDRIYKFNKTMINDIGFNPCSIDCCKNEFLFQNRIDFFKTTVFKILISFDFAIKTKADFREYINKNFKQLILSHLENHLNNIWEPYSKL